MTNDELVLAIQQGESDKLIQLWKQVERLVAWKARRIINTLDGSCSFEFDDLYNSGYIALCDAVERYKPENGSFVSLFMLCLKTAFAETTGYRSARQQRDPIHHASSFDDPVPGADDLLLGDTIPDDTNLEEETVERVWQEQLHDALEMALGTLPPMEDKALRLRFYEGLEANEVAATMGITDAECRNLRHNGLRRLHRREAVRWLEPFVDSLSNFYLRSRVATQESPVELLVIRREELRNYHASRRALLHDIQRTLPTKNTGVVT